MRIGCGILAVWNDCAPGDEPSYETWYLGEHLVERLSIPGFCWGRRYRRLSDAPATLPEYMTYYETDTPEVLTSDAYLERVNDPTPETHRIMTTVFRNMNRTICRRVAGAGAIRSEYVVAIASFGAASIALESLPMPTLTTLWREAWESAEPAEQEMSEEESLRGKDAKITGCILVDCQTQQDALALVADFAADLEVSASAYHLTGSLNAADLS